ncbi:MAG: hypothetical protein ACJA02_001231 [Myxococcota bacterium]|jgi:hypothetical protein
MTIEEKLGDKFSKVSEIVEKLAKLRMEKNNDKTKDSRGTDEIENQENNKENSHDEVSKEKETTLVKELFEAVTGEKSKGVIKESEKTKSETLETNKNQNPDLEDEFTKALRKALEKPKDKTLNSEEKPLTAEELLSKAAEEIKEQELEKESGKKKAPKSAALEAVAKELEEFSKKMEQKSKMKSALGEMKENPVFKKMAESLSATNTGKPVSSGIDKDKGPDKGQQI